MEKTALSADKENLLILRTKYGHLVALQSLLAQENDEYRKLLFQLVKSICITFKKKAEELHLKEAWQEYSHLAVGVSFDDIPQEEKFKLGLSSHIPPYIRPYPHYGKTIGKDFLDYAGLLAHYMAFALLSGEKTTYKPPSIERYSTAVEKVISHVCLSLNIDVRGEGIGEKHRLIFN